MIALAASLLASSAHAQEVGGFVEARLQASVGVDAPLPLFAIERFRPTFEAPLGVRATLSTTIESGLTQGWRSSQAIRDLLEDENIDAATIDSFGLPTYGNEVLAITRANDYLAVDRLFLETYGEVADVRIGRQALNWGSGFVVNPSDPFPEVLLTEPWRPRAGVNAVRVDVPFGELNNVQLIVASDDAFTHPRLATRITVNGLGTDWSLVGAWREEIDEAIVGVDVKGTLGVGFWFEGVAHLPTDGDAPYEEFVAGIDYSMPVLEQLILTAQYYRNGAGDPDAVNLSVVGPREAFASPFTGRNYLVGSVTAGFTPDVSATALWLQNLDDGTAFVVPTATVVATANIDLSLAAQVPIALSGPGEFRPSAQQLTTSLPTADGDVTDVDFSGLVADATLILWSRFNF